MHELLSELVGKPVCLLIDNHVETGILRGVGLGFVCMDVPGNEGAPSGHPSTVRAFFSLNAVRALRGEAGTVNDE